ncbi:tetratricopeptide repeat protein [Nitrosospira briensis]|uniref:tetratricopeptide repeat protein n=1 Tax=Nitrosospira briensis TaxID=35799 RepID=UPI0008E687F4|nr:tetratricopeptide repeat protein [Nitrosospira briensis]SFO38731.1 Flp pilus assembly protein TadD, contains TPR repeats [Nitrosospira briensis]
MEGIAGFKEIAPYLENPLVLIGFVLFLFFGIPLALLKAGILPPLTPRTGGKVVRSFLSYGFVIALLVIALGFAYALFQAHLQHDPDVQKGHAEATRLQGLVEMAKGFCQHPDMAGLDEAARRDVVRACAQAVVALTKVSAPEPQKEEALARLEKGDTQGAKVLFKAVLERKSAEGKASNLEAAEAARHLGALAFYDNTWEALAAYLRAVELDPNNPEGWNRLGHLLARTGELNQAEAAYEKVKTIAESQGDQQGLAVAYFNLGTVYQTRGDLAQAETMYRQALAIDEALGHKEGMANAYSTLGMVYKTRGDLAQAETMYKRALGIYEALGHKEGMANAYGNLGIAYDKRGNLAQAETMYRQALAIFKALGRKEGMANTYSNLGILYRIRGDLAQAETMHGQALAINEALGRKEGMANAYSNLGMVYKTRGDLAEAETMYRQALAIFKAMGRKEGMAYAYSNLGDGYMFRGNLAQAEAMYRQALAIFEAMGHKEGMAADYGNLGIVYQIRGDLAQAETMHRKSIELYGELGMTEDTQRIQGLLDAIETMEASR